MMTTKNEINQMNTATTQYITMSQIIRSQEEKTSFFDKLHNLLWNESGLSPHKALEHMILFFAFRLLNPYVKSKKLPDHCSWSDISQIADEIKLDQTIKKGINDFRKDTITKPYFIIHEIKKAETVKRIVDVINKNITDNDLENSDILGDVFEYMLGRGMSTMADDGQYFTNRLICKKGFELAYKTKGTLQREDGSLCTFADFFCGTGGFLMEYIKAVKNNLPTIDWNISKSQLYAMDKDMSSIRTTLLNCLVQTHVPFENHNIRESNSFSDNITLGSNAIFKGLEIDYMLTNPPYGGDKTKGKDYKFAYYKEIKNTHGKKEKIYQVNSDIQSVGVEDHSKVSAGVQLAMATISKNGGVAAIVLPEGFFFGITAKDVELRKKIAEEYKISYVVSIESGAFANTGTKTSMIVFQRGVEPTEKVIFIDMDDNQLAEATLDDLKEKKYSLNYKQYMPQAERELEEGFKIVKLGDICNVITGNYITKATSEPGEYPIYGGGEAGTKISKFNRENTFVISKDGVSLKCVRYVHGKFFLNHHGWTLEAKNNNLINYIGYLLVFNQNTIYNIANGTAQKGINQEQFYNITIPIPSLEKQQEIVDAIDDWEMLAHQEEASLKLLEKQVMLLVKLMGREQPLVKLGELCSFKRGKSIIKKKLNGGDYPVIGGGKSPLGFHNSYNVDAYTPLIAQSGTAGYISRYTKPVWASDCFAVLSDKINNSLLYYSLLLIQDDIYNLVMKTTHSHVYPSTIEHLKIPLPSLEKQQELQADFDEIIHKHERIAYYKDKAKQAILQHIPK